MGADTFLLDKCASKNNETGFSIYLKIIFYTIMYNTFMFSNLAFIHTLSYRPHNCAPKYLAMTEIRNSETSDEDRLEDPDPLFRAFTAWRVTFGI